MTDQKTITCAFCQGTGNHPHFTRTCPVCRGKGENQIRGKFMTCRDCRGSGQKRGTTLTCYTCGGLGVIPDTREIVAKAREEIRKAREEIKKEREEFREKPKVESNEQEKIEKLKAENERLRKRFSEGKSPPPARGRSEADRGREEGMESAIGSYCKDCVLGENRECWDIECALAPYSPVAATIS